MKYNSINYIGSKYILGICLDAERAWLDGIHKNATPKKGQKETSHLTKSPSQAPRKSPTNSILSIIRLF